MNVIKIVLKIEDIDVMNELEEILKKYQRQPQFEHLQLNSPNQLGIDEDSPFHLACYRGDIDDVNIMIAAGADLNIRGDIGNTPLHYAVLKQRLSVIEALLIAGAKHDLSNDYDDTPLDIAKRGGNQNIILLLDQWGH